MQPRHRPRTRRTRADIAAQTREAILNAACEVIAEIGLEHVRMRMVARAGRGVSTAALHYHFDTRENLFEAALHYSFGSTGADVYEARGDGDTATARLARIIEASLPTTPGLRREWALWQELWCRAGRDAASRRIAVDLYRAHTDWIEETLTAGIASGEFGPVDVAAHAQLINAVCDGYGVHLMMRSPTVSLEQALASIWTIATAPLGVDSRVPGGPPTMTCERRTSLVAACWPPEPVRRSPARRPAAPTSTRPGPSRCPPSGSCRRSTATSSTSTGPTTSTPSRCSRASRRSTASRSSSRTSTRWRRCRPSSPPATGTTSSSRRRSGCRSSTPPTSSTRSTTSVLENAAAIFDHYDYFADPWYDPGSAHSIPFSMYKTGIAWRKDKLGDELTGSWRDLWNEDA